MKAIWRALYKSDQNPLFLSDLRLLWVDLYSPSTLESDSFEGFDIQIKKYFDIFIYLPVEAVNLYMKT